MPRIAIAFLLLLLVPGLAEALRRGVRVDGFGTWNLFEDPNPTCFGWSNGSTLLLGPGLVFSGRDDPSHLTDTYCQTPVPGTLTQSEFFYPDETALAAMIGPNTDGSVFARRYSLLDRPRFDFENPPTGFQWTFYYFAQGGTIVGLYGLEEVELDDRSYITQNGVRVWDAARDGFDGQYFCFEGVRYVGTWDGTLPSNSPCVLIGFRLFRGSFE
jgi:hypothetical protein